MKRQKILKLNTIGLSGKLWYMLKIWYVIYEKKMHHDFPDNTNTYDILTQNIEYIFGYMST